MDTDKTATADFTISKAAPTANAPEGLTATYGQTLANVSLENVNPEGNTEGTWEWTDGTQSVGDVVTPAATFPANFTPTDTANYNSVSNVGVAVTVGKAANPAEVTSIATVAKGGSDVDLANCVTLNGATGDVTYAFDGAANGCSLNGSVLTSGDTTGTVTVNVTVAEDGNHNASEAMPITVTISEKAAQTITASDVTATYGDTGKRVVATTDGNGEISYAVKEGADVIDVDAKSGALTIKKAGTATVTVTAAETSTCAQATKDVAVTVNKANSRVTKAPAATNPTYDGKAHPLVTSGTAEGGTMQYSLDGKSWSDEVPTGTDAKAYDVWYKVAGDANHNGTEARKVTSTIAKPADALALTGTGHLQGTGDVGAKASGKGISIGTTGQARRLEQFSVSLPKGTDGSIRYRVHLQSTGWCGWVEGGRSCGTRGESRRVEAVQMELAGKVADGYSVWYRVHSQTYGWLGWAHDGQAAGTSGQAKRAEDVEVQVLPKGQVPEGYSESLASYIGAATANVHLQGTGWTGSRSALSFGTTGQSRRLEAVRISLGNQPLSGGVEYDVHLQGKGWQNGYADGATAGTTGQSRRLEAVRIRLTGDMAKQGGYSVWYRVHSQTYGWLGWAKDGGVAGTTGLAKRAEAIEVQVLPQGQVPSGYDVGKAASVIG